MKNYRHRAAGYLVVQAMDYKDDPASYTYCRTRADVAAQLIDFGYLENPAVQVFALNVGEDPHTSALVLSRILDPYPDWVVSRGPRGGVVWERA